MSQRGVFNEIGRGAWRRVRAAVSADAARAIAPAGLGVGDLQPGGQIARLGALRLGSRARGAELLAGRFAFADGRRDADRPEALWSVGPGAGAFDQWLHGFGWLADVSAADGRAGPEFTRAVVDGWIAAAGSAGERAIRPGVAARRILSWLAAGPALFDGAGAARRLEALVRQARKLDGAGRATPDGPARMTRAIALAAVGACIGDQDRLMAEGLKACAEEADRQILADGGHIGRSPEAVAEILADLLALDHALAERGVDAPSAMRRAIDRMAPMLRFFKTGDGGLACFHGGGEGDRAMIGAALACDDAGGRAFGYAPHSGYQRVEAGGAHFIMDVGAPASGRWGGDAHASALSFEFSAPGGRLIVNCGWSADLPERLRDPVRASAAHSTLVVADTSSAGGDERGRREAARASGVAAVAARRNEEELGVWIEGSHEGYRAEFGVAHRRRVFISRNADDLRGEDTLFRPVDDPAAANARPLPYAARFHLHPHVRASLARDRRSAHLVLPDGEAWRLKTDCGPLTLERSIYLGAGGAPAETRQIVVTGAAQTDKPIDRPPNRARWALKRLGRAPVF